MWKRILSWGFKKFSIYRNGLDSIVKFRPDITQEMPELNNLLKIGRLYKHVVDIFSAGSLCPLTQTIVAQVVIGLPAAKLCNFSAHVVQNSWRVELTRSGNAKLLQAFVHF